MLACVYVLDVRTEHGIPDIAVKLFMCAQWRGMLDGTETFSIETLAAIMSNELSRVAPIVDALRTGDTDALCLYEDITPPEFTSLLDDALNAYEGVRQRGAALTADNPALVPRVASYTLYRQLWSAGHVAASD